MINNLYLDVFKEFRGVVGFFSTRTGACEKSSYDNEAVFKELELEKMTFVRPVQVHGDNVAVIGQDCENACDNAYDKVIVLPDTDGMVTDRSNVLLTTVHADCIPVYFYDPKRKAIGLVHSGWRGTNLGIASTAVMKMEAEYGCKAHDIYAYIGPGISKCCFETGPEVYREFKANWDFMDDCAVEAAGGTGKYYIDLKSVIRIQLMRAGVEEGHINISAHCTCCEPELFVSYRREGGTTMRMGAGIAILKL